MGVLMAFDSPNLVLQFLGHLEREEKKRREGAIFLTFPRKSAGHRRSACCFELALRVPTGP